MKQALFGNVSSEVAIDRDGYDCGHYYDCYYLLFSEDDTVDCYETMHRCNTISSLIVPVARGLFQIEDKNIFLTLQRKEGTSDMDPVPTAYDTYGPRSALDIVFTTAEYKLDIGKQSVSLYDMRFELLDGDETLLLKHSKKMTSE